MTDRSTIEMLYQAHKTTTRGWHGPRVLPDHYPLATRDGVIEVAQLSDRGLLGQARYRASDAAADYAASLDDGVRGFVPDGSYAAGSQPAPAAAAAPVEAPSLAQGPSQVSGQAKIIDVQATLAMR